MIFSPISITIGPKTFGILPADREYKLNDNNYFSKLTQHTTWVKRTFSEGMIKVDVFTATDDFKKIINENGLYTVFFALL